MKMHLASQPAFIAWGIINIFAALWEVYAFVNRDKLKLEKITLWEKMAKGEITLSNFWIEGWSEYCKVDPRYLFNFSSGGYVWVFELLNVVLAFAFIIVLLANSSVKSISTIKLILQIAIINCILYFVTLLLERIKNELDKNNVTGFARYSRYTKFTKYARWWQYPVYFLISGIWLIVPLYLYFLINKHNKK
jgi:hypothetical protein